MRTACILTLTLFISIEASAQPTIPAALLKLTEVDQAHEIAVQVMVDQQSYDDYWTKTIDAIFGFADSNSDGVISDDEIGLVPSARAVRLSLGNGFTPPIASLQSVKEIVGSDSPKCSKEALRKYYLRDGAGRLTIGYGKLPNTGAITQALIKALDEDRDGKLSEGELQKAEKVLRRLDANDDELIGVGELVPNATYPGNWAANSLAPSAIINLSRTGDASVTLQRQEAIPSIAANKTAPAQVANWQIAIFSDRVHASPLKLATKSRVESWSVGSPLSRLNGQFREFVAKADTEPAAEAETTRDRGRRPTRAWLMSMVDRDHDGNASQEEIDRWLALQHQIVHGQLLISVYYGGGLFELVDRNHDAALSIRELRTAWQVLKSAGCTSDTHLEVPQIPDVLLFVVSQGYPDSLVKPSVSDVEWFRRMDRNSDGDVSNREFTGSPEAFNRLDTDRDGLISRDEAAVKN